MSRRALILAASLIALGATAAWLATRGPACPREPAREPASGPPAGAGLRAANPAAASVPRQRVSAAPGIDPGASLAELQRAYPPSTDYRVVQDKPEAIAQLEERMGPHETTGDYRQVSEPQAGVRETLALARGEVPESGPYREVSERPAGMILIDRATIEGQAAAAPTPEYRPVEHLPPEAERVIRERLANGMGDGA